MLSINSKAKSYDEMSEDEKKLYDTRKKQKILGNINTLFSPKESKNSEKRKEI